MWTANLPTPTGFRGPTFVALDVGRNIGGTTATWLYVSEHGETTGTGGGRILRYNLTAGGAPTVIATAGTGAAQFTSPDAILVDSATGNLMIADRAQDVVKVITNTGSPVMTFGQGTDPAAANFMDGPLGLARDSAGAIYLTEHNSNMVAKYTISGTTATQVWRRSGTTAGGTDFSTPYGIAVVGSELYISDGFNARVVRWTADGVRVGDFAVASGTIPLGLSVTSAGSLVLAESNAGYASGGVNRISIRSTPAGTVTQSFGSFGTGDGGMRLPFHAVVDGSTAYVADYENNRVQVWNLAATPPSDTTPPTVAVTGGSGSSSPATFSVTFSETVTGVAAGAFTATGSGGATPGTISVSGSGATYTVTVPFTGTTGSIVLSLNSTANTTIRDAANNFYAGGATAGSSNTATFTVTSAPPPPPADAAPRIETFALQSAATPAPDGSGTAVMRVTFNEAVTGVDTADFAITTTSGAAATITGVTPSATTSSAIWDVAFSYPGTAGALQMGIRTVSTGITDAAGTAFLGEGATGTAAIAVNASGVDTTTPTVSSVTAGTLSGSTLPFTVTFSEAVTGVGTTDFLVKTTGTATGTVASVTAVSTTVYTVNVTVGGTGTVQLVAIGGVSSNIRDTTPTNGHWFVGGGTPASAAVSVGGGGGGGDTTPPAVASFTIASSTASSVTYQIVFSEAVTGVDTADFTAVRTPTTAGSAAVASVSGSGTTYSVVVNFTGTTGSVGLNLNASGTGIQDAAGNAIATGATGPTHTVGAADTTPPTVASFTIASSTASSVTYQIVFSEAVTGVDTADFTAVRTPTTAGSAAVGSVSGSGTTYSVVVNFTGTTGSVGLNLNASGTGIQDAAGNAIATGATGPTHTVGAADTTPPTVSSFTIASSTSSSVTYTIVFSESVTGVDTADFTAVRSPSTSTATVASVTGSGTTRTVVVNFTGTTGSVGLNLNASGTGIQDTAGNAIATGATGPTHTLAPSDTTAPTVSSFTIASSTATSVTYQLVFSENVTGVNSADFTAVRAPSGSGTATVGTVSGTGTTYTIPVSFTGTSGTIQLILNGSGTGIADAAGNAIASGATSPVHTASDTTAPTVQNFYIAAPSASSVVYQLTFSESVTGVDATDFTAVRAPTGSGTATVGSVTGSGASYSITVTFTGTSGTVQLNLNASGTAIADTSGNALVGGRTGDVLTIGSSPSPSPTPTPTPTPPPVFLPPPAPAPTLISQTVTFNSPVSVIIVNQPVTLGAVASSNLPITYSIVSGNATLDGNVLTVRNTAPVTVRATQSGSSIFAAASAEITVTAQRASQSIALAAMGDLPANASPIALVATTSAGLPISYSVSGPARVAGNVLTLTGAPGAVTVRANAAGNDAYNAAAEVVRTFNVRAIGQMVHMGRIGSDPIAIVVSQDGTSGILVTRLSGSGEAIIGKFRIVNGTFSGNATGSTPASADELPQSERPSTAALTTSRAFSGTINNGVITGTFPELGATFNADIVAPTGSATALSGVYIARIPGSASGEAYIVVSPTGEAYAVSITPLGVTSGTGSVNSEGVVTINTTGGGTIAGSLDANTGTLNGTVSQGTTTAALVGISEGSNRTDRLVNLSSRLRVATGDASRSVIAGFVVSGTDSKRVLVRAIGPGLAGFGVTGALANPRLQLYNSAGALIGENDDWNNNAEVAAISAQVGAFSLTAGSRDSAVLATLAPGAYTAVVSGVGGDGVALVEVYDASNSAQLASPQLVNISTRGFVDTGDGNLIAGFVITGNAPKRVLIRGIGPGLTQFGVNGAVANPSLRLFAAGSSTAIAQNDDWNVPQPINAAQVAATSADIAAASTATGAFPLPANSRDAAIVITLMPGQYSAVVSGANNGTGAGLVEVYEISNL